MSLSETIRVNDALIKANERIKKLECEVEEGRFITQELLYILKDLHESGLHSDSIDNLLIRMEIEK